MALTPMMWDHVQDIYDAMNERAEYEPTEYFDPEVNNDKVQERKIYTGHLTSLFGELGKPAPYYTSIMTALKAMGCVEQLRRGGGSAPSKWILCHPPTEDGYMAFVNNRNPSHAKRGRIDGIDQKVQLLMERVQRIEDHLVARENGQ